jgi:phosphomannomutase/phosphoglucomutase
MMNQEKKSTYTFDENISVSSDIFRSYDIRGVADSDPLNPDEKRRIDLTASQAWLIGKAYGTWIKHSSGSRVVVGRDNRRTSIEIASGFMIGVLSTGCDVIDIGLSTTPLLYFSVEELDCDGGMMVTGSHNPMWSNGLKLSKPGYRTLVSDEIQSLYQTVINQGFNIGEGNFREENIIDIYIEALKDRVKPACKSLRVVVDPGNATGGLFAPRFLSELGYEVIPINSELIYPFPKGSPDPEQPDKVKELGEKVLEYGADVGVAYDGDADRVGIVDEKGQKIESDLLLLLLARKVLEENEGAEIVFDIKCSDLLPLDIKKRGGLPVMWKTGHSNIKQKMAEDAAKGIPVLLGGELSGHIFFRDHFYGFDDAIYVSARVLEILSRTEVSMSQLLGDLPQLRTTRELALPCPDNKKTLVIDNLLERFKSLGYDVIDIDGIRIPFEKYKWALIRASNTQPKLTARFQAKDRNSLIEIVELIRGELDQFDFIDAADLEKGLKEVVG